MKKKVIEAAETVGELVEMLKQLDQTQRVVIGDEELCDGIVVSRGAEDEVILEAYYE